MKTDLATSVVAAIIGIVAAYFICNMIIPPIADVKFPTLNSSTTYMFDDPDPELFNYRAINPTVEVYVGQCAEYNEYGECIENVEYIESEDTDTENEDTDKDNKKDEDSQSKENDKNQTEVNEETQNGTSN